MVEGEEGEYRRGKLGKLRSGERKQKVDNRRWKGRIKNTKENIKEKGEGETRRIT